MLAEYLRLEGFEVLAVPNGESGVTEAVSGRHAIVVLDVMLPDMSGIEALTRIRLQTRVPVLMLTAKGDDLNRIMGLEFGADDYVPKPCTPRELVARIRAILRRTQGSRRNSRHADSRSADVAAPPTLRALGGQAPGLDQHRIQSIGSFGASCRPGGRQDRIVQEWAGPSTGAL